MFDISKLEHRFSHHIIAANDDLLSEILIRLPIKSLLRFKSVSRHWLFLITSPYFSHCKSRKLTSAAISGLLVHRSSVFINQDYDFVPLDDKQPVAPPFKTLTFVEDPLGITVLQSCNGLLLCRSFREQIGKCRYYVFNPTTRQFTTLPDPLHHQEFMSSSGDIPSIYAVNLAFDPRNSPYYKVICIYVSKSVVRDYYEVEIYSSETGFWKQVADSFSTQVYFSNGVYWNGAINWMSYRGDSLYFNVDDERFGTLPMLPSPDGWENGGRKIKYFGESNDHLSLIVTCGPRTTQFNVYEMDREYFGWFVKYRVDLEPVTSTFPECKYSETDYSFFVIGLARRKDDEESFLALSIPGKAVRYNLGDKSFKKLCDFSPESKFVGSPMFAWFDSFQFIESLAPVIS